MSRINFISILFYLMSLVLAPLLPGIINRVKAFWGGRQGQPLLQGYFDLFRLLNKSAVYSQTTTWLFYVGPMVSLAAILSALALLPMFGFSAVFSFSGDIILFIYCFGLVRFFTVIAALDTGSSFEGMGASREVLFSALAEPGLFLVLVTFVQRTDALSLTEIFRPDQSQFYFGPGIVLAAVSFFVILLAENSRIPVDDPNTHLELTMIHEVMVLDHSGPDLAFIHYGASLKLWIMTALLAQILVPVFGSPLWLYLLLVFVAMLVITILIGIVESTMARLRLVQVPQLLTGAFVLALLGYFISR